MPAKYAIFIELLVLAEAPGERRVTAVTRGLLKKVVRSLGESAKSEGPHGAPACTRTLAAKGKSDNVVNFNSLIRGRLTKFRGK